MDKLNSAAPADFDELADWLLSIGSHFSPAELHGAIVGALAGAMRLPARQWALFGLAVTGADERLDQQQLDAAIEKIGGLAAAQLDKLASTDLSFQLFLPDDDYDLEQRTESLAHWCKGFLGGFAEARAHGGKPVEPGRSSELPATVVESLQDMAAIAQASAGRQDEQKELYDEEMDDDDDFEPFEVTAPQSLTDSDGSETGEMGERDYNEVSEYLRLAALTVFTEHGWVEAAASAQGKPSPATQSREKKGPTLH